MRVEKPKCLAIVPSRHLLQHDHSFRVRKCEHIPG